MTARYAAASSLTAGLPEQQPPVGRCDGWSLAILGTLLGLGLIAMYSASITFAEQHFGDPLYYLKRQLAWLSIGLCLAAAATRLPLKFWDRLQAPLLCLGFLGLILVLLPGMGREVNGATRWLPLGSMSLQVSEPFKLALMVYLAGYLVRHRRNVAGRSVKGYLVPSAVLGLAGLLLLAQPDFGTAVVLAVVLFGMLFVGGVSIIRFLFVALTAAALFVTLALLSPYRLRRLMSFIDPWAAPHDHAFQLTQSLIAFGRGGWTGEGLGGSLQKLFYLPEAHTDFVFAVYAEELGFIGSALLIGLFLALVWRCFAIAALAAHARQWFNAYLVYGIGMLISVQVFINMGVNTGLLPTKGLTLPLVSYGGSSLAICCLLFGIMLRAGREAAPAPSPARPMPAAEASA